MSHMASPLTLGTLVEHSAWGLGKIVEIKPPYFVAHFTALIGTETGARRKLLLAAPQISIAAVQADEALDKVVIGPGAKKAKSNGGKPKVKPTLRPVGHAIDWFCREYPKGFQDPKLVEMELDYKRKAHQMFIRHFGNGRGQALLDAGDVQTIAPALDELYRATNIPASFEIMAVHDGLKDGRAAAQLLRSVLDFIDAPPDARSFARLVDAVSALPAPSKGSRVLTWPNVTILPFLADPRRFMVLKPALTQRMAQRLRFNLLYTSRPEWHTYDALQQMSAMLLERLAPLGAEDFIDVQSFMWVTQDLE